MVSDDPHLADLRAAYQDWLGTPSEIMTLRHRGPAPQLPTRLDLLFFQSGATDDVPENERFTFVATAGISTLGHTIAGNVAEAMLEIGGTYSLAELRGVGMVVAEVVMHPLRQGLPLQADTVIRRVAWPVFHGMTSALLTHWPGPDDTWLADLDPPVEILQVIPLFETEADWVMQRGDRELLEHFSRSGVNWNDPHRPCL